MNYGYIRLKTFSESIGIKQSTLRNYIKQGVLNSIKIGGNYYVTLQDINNFNTNILLLNKGISKNNLNEINEKLRKFEKQENEEKQKKLWREMGIPEKNIDKLNNIYNLLGKTK